MKFFVDTADVAEIKELAATGARCVTSLVLSSPVPWRDITPPEGTTQQRTRLTRRRRKPAAGKTPRCRSRGISASSVSPPAHRSKTVD